MPQESNEIGAIAELDEQILAEAYKGLYAEAVIYMYHLKHRGIMDQMRAAFSLPI